MFFYPPAISNEPVSQTRKGFTLLMVVTFLALFAVVGVGFVMYAQSEATSSRYYRQSREARQPEMDPELLLSYFLGQFLYGVSDNSPAGVMSALRGTDLATNTYGVYYQPTPGAPGLPLTLPYNGTGRLHFAPSQQLLGTDDYPYINYQYFGTDGFLRDPGRIAGRTAPGQPLTPPVIGVNPGHTYPDMHNLFLAAMTAKGEILMQSFHRPWYFGPLTPGNPNWTAKNPAGKYMTLRPRPAEHPGIGFPADPGGDVKNLPNGLGVPIPGAPGQYYNNDSIWVDLGHPVMTGPDGRKFKPLFAALVIPLDGKVNLNVAGNIKGPGPTNAGNQGWGAYTTNLSRVMNTDANPNANPPTPPMEWKKIFLGNGQITGRYGPDGQPDNAKSQAPSGLPPHWWAQVDFDGTINPNIQGPSGPALFPGENNTVWPGYVAFPYYPPGRYGNGSVFERTNHPLLFNFFNPFPGTTTYDRVFPWSSMEPILRYGDSGSPFLSTDLFRLCPINFQNPRVRLQLTTHSFDNRRPSAQPWLTGYNATDYVFRGSNLYPNGLPRPAATPPASNLSEYLGGYGVAAALERININRTLVPYPPPRNGSPNDTDTAKMRILDLNLFQQAQKDRQRMAKDIFDRLVLVTTGLRPGQGLGPKGPFNPVNKGTPPYEALRWLAQLAVNMVDFRDEDAYMTPFQWNPALPTEFVYGTEQPRLVLNEVYSQIGYPVNVVPVAGTPLAVQFWVELLNPLQLDKLQTGPTMWSKGYARLQLKTDPNIPASVLAQYPATAQVPLSASYAAYNVTILNTSDPTKTKTNMRALANVKGDPDPADVTAGTSQGFSIVNNFTPMAGPPVPATPADNYWLVQTVDQASLQPNFQGKTGKNQGFFLLSPMAPFPGQPNQTDTNPATPSLQLPTMSYQIPSATFNPGSLPVNTILLRRLACPHLPPQENPLLPYYNPYITIDYVEKIPSYLGPITIGGVPNVPNWQTMNSWGRMEPYTAYNAYDPNNANNSNPQLSKIQPQKPNPVNATQPQHTFFRHNSVEGVASQNPQSPSPATPNQTLDIPFNWLVHMDRQLISPMELLQVPAFHPHEMTQQFIAPNPGAATPTLVPYNHLARWFQQNTRLYRVMEFIETASRAAGVRSSPRVPGKIDINNVWDVETFQALCDAQGLRLTPAQVTVIFQKMMASRSPKLFASPNNPGLTMNDRPFMSMTTGVEAANTNLPWTMYGPGDTQATKTQTHGLMDTFFRDITGGANPAKLRLFGVPPNQNNFATNHPYRKAELMSKIFNNITTRSNVFAVWLTVGFFEVQNENTMPVTLGPEIGLAENRHVRYRMFAIVDRTQLGAVRANLMATVNGQLTPVSLATPVATTPPALQPGVQTVTLTAMSGMTPPPPPAIQNANANINLQLKMPRGAYKWAIQPGMGLVIDKGTANEETIIVTQIAAANTITAYFHKPHSKGALVSLPGVQAQAVNMAVTPPRMQLVPGVIYGHPGHQPRFDMRQYPAVVPHWSIIEKTGG